MSPASAIHVHTPPRTITRFRPWPVLEPLAKSALDFLFLGVGVISAQVLTHQPKPRLEQIERRAKRVGERWRGRGHIWIVPPEGLCGTPQRIKGRRDIEAERGGDASARALDA